MDYNKIFTDFEKRYGEKCQAAYFVGKPITFFSRSGMTAGCSLSTGGCIALSKRDDDRVEVQFSDSTEYISCNRLNFKHNRENKIINLLLEMEKYGVKTGGVKAFMFYNTTLSAPFEPMFFAAAGSFCENASTPTELAKHFDEFEKNTICLSSKKDLLTVFDGQRVRYAPLPDSQVKIVLSYTGERVFLKNLPQDKTVENGINALLRGDWDEFGRALDKETKWIAENNNLKGLGTLFDTAVRLQDAYGSGVLEDGGIFSVVKNSRVDTFMHNLGAEYEKHFGSCPDFYVTRAEDSGVSVMQEKS